MITAQREIPTFLAPAAFEMIRVGHTAIHHDPEALQNISDMARDEFGEGYALSQTIDETTLVYRHAGAGLRRPEYDPPFATSVNALYYPDQRLSFPASTNAATVGKDVVEATGKPHVIEVHKLDRPMVAHYVGSLIWPGAEDSRIIAGGSAWKRQAREAFSGILPGPTINETKKKRLAEEVVRRYAGAIVLDKRS